MKKLIIILLITPAYVFAISDSCVVPGSSVEIDMTRKMVKDFGILASSMDNFTMELLAIAPVSKLMAKQYAIEDRAADLAKFGKYSLSYQDYFSSYYYDEAKSLLIKYAYENKNKQKNIFIASSIVNNNECSVRFNGYLVVQREF